ncbi:hypothetical protein KORDIASMS9_02195 [Kordia sp. SMS9]|uniref:hypothetical protein n=1 Tax=Kordia sp. SMS9 TaxID=2282170 RepID=UPI000E0D54A0|nr:hypothetical protein [Kordia sp. SMS9]AXG69966.1 hypothetical protein KORDIASMS9_02195 [Kordia sp. SMS9]
MHKIATTFLGICIFLGITNSAFSQGNYRIENFGSRSILLNGNVTGSVDDLGLVYYNPSRLSLIEKPAFSVSGKAYEVSSTNLTNAFGAGNNVSNQRIGAVPTMIAGTLTLKFLPKDKFAYSFLSRHRVDNELAFNTGVLDGDQINIPGAERFIGSINLEDVISEEWFGFSWSRKISSKFSIGASMFLSVYEMNGAGKSLYAGESASDEVVTYNSDFNYEQETYGLFFKIGASYKTEGLELGATVHIPHINIYDSAKFRAEEFLAGLGAPDDFFNVTELRNVNNKRRTALGVSVGAGIPIGKSKIHINTEWYDGLNAYKRIAIPDNIISNTSSSSLDFREKLKSVINFGAGAEIYISPVFTGFLSFSSDYSAYVESANFFDVVNQNGGEINYESDYWHFGFGVDANIKWGRFLLGTTYSRTSTDFNQPINFPTEPINTGTNSEITTLKLSRWRFILGVEIPLFN